MKITKEQIEIVSHFAWKMVGIPYKLGGNVPQDGGMDCSAFVLELLRALGLWGLDDARAQDILNKYIGFTVAADKKIQKGDILFFGKNFSNITHVAWAETEVFMLEAGGTDKSGMIRLRSITWRKDLVAVARFT